MNDYKSQIKAVVDSIRQDMRVLGMFAFQGVGDIDVLRNCFIRSYEAAIEGEKIYKEHFPDTPLNAPITLCDGDTNIEPIKEFYDHLKSEEFVPMPFDVPKYGEYTMTLNHLFIALQQAGI
jgi:hypothetical protein